jgi:geranylgeranyl diphosphate synthase type I
MPSLAEETPAVLTRHLAAIEIALQEAIGAAELPLTHAARYVMGWEDERGAATQNQGKRIRPALCLFAADHFGGAPEVAMPGAIAIELVHNFSLVHDEVQDRDEERHHRPTAWRIFGDGQAINLGDHLYTTAVAALTAPGGNVERRMAALRVLNTAIARMIQGQWEDLAFESRGAVAVADYLRMASGKTGALLGAPLEIGALLAGAPPEEAAILGQWGNEVGLAFQSWDDYLGIWGDPSATGKSNNNDIARRKKTLPIVHGLAHPAVSGMISAAYDREGELTPAEIEAITSALREAGADRACRDAAAEHAGAADALIEPLVLRADVRESFRAVAEYFYQRDV